MHTFIDFWTGEVLLDIWDNGEYELSSGYTLDDILTGYLTGWIVCSH